MEYCTLGSVADHIGKDYTQVVWDEKGKREECGGMKGGGGKIRLIVGKGKDTCFGSDTRREIDMTPEPIL